MHELLSLDNLTRMSNSDLAKVSSQITGRLNNEDWQQMVYDLRVSGHIHSFAESAPLLLQRFIKLEIDLDAELSRRSETAPLLSTVSLNPRRPRPEDRQLLASVSSQDSAATMEIEINPALDQSEFAFTVRSMLTMRFRPDTLDKEEQRQFITNMRRDIGMSFLWTRDRWEKDYLIFIRQEFFTRVYAFSGNLEATARLTTGATGELLDWLERCWFPRQSRRSSRRTIETTALDDKRDTSQLKRLVEKLGHRTEGDEAQLPPVDQSTTGGEDNPFTW